MPDSNDLLKEIAGRSGAVMDYTAMDNEDRLMRETASRSRWPEEMNYIGPSAGSTIGSGVGSVLGAAISRSMARHMAATAAGVVIGTAIVASVWGGKLVLRTLGPKSSLLTVSNIITATGFICTALYQEWRANQAKEAT